VAFLLAIAILFLSGLAGFTRTALTTHALPALAQDPLAEGHRLVAAGRLREGRAEFHRALRIYPANFSFTVEVADGLLKSGDARGALEVLERARAMRPSSAVVYSHIGVALLQQRKLDEAEAAFGLARRLDSGDGAALQGLGDVLVERDRYAEAVAVLREAVGVDPRSTAIHNSLGIALALAGRPQEAVDAFEVALGLGPTPEIRANRDRAAAAARVAGGSGAPAVRPASVTR
jgi:tetratricopeptide (TPR) repeat protein